MTELGVNQQIRDLTKQEQVLRTRLVDLINEIPDNPDAKIVAKNCFIVRSSALLDNWSPHFYNFSEQREELVKLVNRAALANLLPVLWDVVSTGELWHSKNKTTFHPGVRDALEVILCQHGE